MDASRYISIPYVYGGRSFDGCDCYGLLVLFYDQEFGIDVSTYKEVGDENSPKVLKALTHSPESEWDKIEESELRFGDAVTVMNGTKKYPNHCAIYIGKGRFLHTSSQHGCTIVSRKAFDGKIYAFYRNRMLHEGKINPKLLREEGLH